MHQAVLAALEGRDLVDAGGRVRIDAIRAHVESRLERLPELRWKLRRTHLLEGRPLWVDDPGFRIEEHVLAATLPAPGGETAAMKFAERQMETRMDRSRPLWEMWFLDGYAPDKVGLLIKLHHAMADGPAMVRLLGQLFDIESRPPERPREEWHPAPSPTPLTLVRDNFARKGAALGRALSRLHPVRAARSTAVDVRASLEEVRQARGAPRTSLNHPIGASRRIAAVHMSLADAKQVAHAAGVKLNDVFFCIVATALRQVLEARGELRPGMALRFRWRCPAEPRRT